MRRFLVVLAAAVIGCGGNGNGEAADAGTPDAGGLRQMYVVSRIVLPADTTQLNDTKFEFPGTQGMPVNRLGSVLQVLIDLIEGIPVQAQIDANLKAGAALQGLVFFSQTGLTGTDDSATAAWVPLVDADDPPDPANDFTGSGQFRLAPGASLAPAWTDVSIAAGMVTGVGEADLEAVVQVPVKADDPVQVAGVYQQMRITGDDDQLAGAISGAITPEDLDANITPAAAELLQAAVAMDLPNAQEILDLLDGNGDGRITAEDLEESPLLTTLTAPDIDLDGDGVMEHISLGVMIEAVRAELLLE